MSVLKLLDLLAVLGIELTLDVIVSSKNTLHVLFSLFFGVEQAQLSSINLVFESLALLF